MAKLVDAPDLGSGGVTRGGSSPSSRTIFLNNYFGANFDTAISIGHDEHDARHDVFAPVLGHTRPNSSFALSFIGFT